MTCSKCGYKSEIHFQTCPECSFDIVDATYHDPQKASSKGLRLNQTGVNSIPVSAPGTGAIDTLRFFAWLDLAAGLIGAIVIWANFGTREIASGSYLSYTFTKNVVDPVGVGVGIAVLLQGIFVCAFFLVIASIGENLIAIRKNTQPK